MAFEWTLNQQDVFEGPGLVALVYHNTYPEGKQGGVEVIQHGERILSCGDLRLTTAPGQWGRLPQPGGRVAQAEARAVSVSGHFTDPEIAYTVRVAAEGAALRVSVDLHAPLPEALSSAMTFGYYAPQTLDQDKGLFIFNSVNLSKGPLNNIGALNYHELVPGHHFHLATQQENETLHPLRQRSIVNAYNEGWAEYAATFAGEIGMYREPEERFGRLMMDAFLTCRLVVDTGMNVLGWTIEEARQYLRNNGFMPEAEIHSETIRYSCDMPGQALAYKLGDTFLYDARERMRTALGDRFDIRDFHDAVLKPGALPLPLLKQHVERETERLANIGADD